MGDVLAATAWDTNAHLIEAAASLGYLRREWATYDASYGYGTFWARWRPDALAYGDIDPEKSYTGESLDFTKLPWVDDLFDAVVLDPPYRYNGQPDDAFDERYGTHRVTRWQDRRALILDGIAECARILSPTKKPESGGIFLLKCQDQVVSGKVRWQTREFADHAERNCGLELIDMFHMLGGRPQPKGRRQVHARRNHSSLLVFHKGA